MTTSPTILLDSGNGYVARGTNPEEIDPPKLTDEVDDLGRSPQDKRFLEQFQRIFPAASKGDLATCQAVVAEGFKDFDAYSFGKFADESGTPLDGVKVREIAEWKKHDEIVKFFQHHQQLNSSR